VLISDKKIFIIGYRKRSHDAWISMDKVLYNRIDADWELNQLKQHAPKWQYKIFEGSRFK